MVAWMAESFVCCLVEGVLGRVEKKSGEKIQIQIVFNVLAKVKCVWLERKTSEREILFPAPLKFHFNG